MSAGNCSNPPLPPLFYCVLLCWFIVCCALSLKMYWQRYALFNICCAYGRVFRFRRIYRCLLLTVITYFRGLVDYLLSS